MRLRLIIAALCAFGGTAVAHAQTAAAVRAEPMFFAYPKDAYAAQQEGRVAVELAISERGAVEGCTVVERVAPSLDEASCRFWKRAQFSAALDNRGRPVPSTLRKYSDWRLR